MRWVFLALLTVHALVHFMGAAKGFGWAELPELRLPVSKSAAVAWLVVGVVLLVAATMFVLAPRWWWIPGAVGLLGSQLLIVSAWSDARFGTVANVALLIAVVYGFASLGPTSMRATYEREVRQHLDDDADLETPLVTEADLGALPAPVACWMRRSGVVGQPRAKNFKAVWKGRIRGTSEDPWMTFTAEQYNFFSDDTRLFFMDARRSGLPVDVLHRFADGQASMRVKLVSLLPLVEVSGPKPTRAETVTLLNDMSVLAPSGLLRSDVTWAAIDDRASRVSFTLGVNTVTGVLHFDESCDLVDFVSDDRFILGSDGETFTPQRWSTPLRGHRTFGTLRVAGGGEGRWHSPEGDYAYLEMELVSLETNVGAR